MAQQRRYVSTMDTRHRDSRHWSQRWMRVSILESDAVVMYDLHEPVEIPSCGKGNCRPVSRQGATPGRRYRVCCFRSIETCRHCGRVSGVTGAEKTLYYGDSEDDALNAYAQGEEALLGRLAA